MADFLAFYGGKDGDGQQWPSGDVLLPALHQGC